MMIKAVRYKWIAKFFVSQIIKKNLEISGNFPSPVACPLLSFAVMVAGSSESWGDGGGNQQSCSNVKSRQSVLFQDSLETHFGCFDLGLVGWCLGLGVDVVVLSIS